MKKYFYSEIVDFEWIEEEFKGLELSERQKGELLELARLHLHQIIQEAILSELSEKDKKIFLANLEYESHDRTWEHLNEKVEKVEEKIKKAAEELGRDLKKDIADIKSTK